MDLHYDGVLIKEPKTNITLVMGDGDDQTCQIQITFYAEKTIRNRIKYWLFCKFFPFRIKSWE